MATVLNPSFEDWNQGAIFVDPVDGTELADDWFWHKGSAPTTTIIQRVITPTPYDGSFAMRQFVGSGGGGGNTTSYAYTDVSSHNDLLGKLVLVTVAIRTQLVTAVTGHFFVDDGINAPVHSASNAIDDTWHLITVMTRISPAAPYVRIGVMVDSYGFTQAFFDFVQLSVVQEINLTEGVTPVDEFSTEPILQPLHDAVTINDWFSIKKTNSDPWS